MATNGEDDIDAIKSRQNLSASSTPMQQGLPGVRIPTSVSSQGLARILRKPRLSRNASTPACSLAAAADTRRSAFASSNQGSPSKAGSRPTGPRRSSSSISSSRRSILGSERMSDSESSDDENGSQGRNRLGGCSQQSQGSDEPNDGNKENVAPFRCASSDILNQEARDAQEESVARRTRGRRSSLMERQSSAVASPVDSTPRAVNAAERTDRMRRPQTLAATRSIVSSPSSVALPRTPSKRTTRSRSDLASRSSPATSSLLSTPPRPALANYGSSSNSSCSSGRKRSRQAIDEDVEDRAGLRTPGTPFSRMRLSPRKAAATSDTASFDVEDMDSYFGSQASSGTASGSLFDASSQAGSSSSAATTAMTSREPSPTVHDALAKSSSMPAAEQYSNVYSHARAMLRYAAGVDPAETEAGLTICGDRRTDSHVKVVGRAKERVAIEQFLDQRLGLFPNAKSRADSLDVELDGDTESGCLYVCGLPGTGKTALVRSVLNGLSSSTVSERARPTRIAFVNCMTLSHPRFVFGKVLSALGSDAAEGQSDVEAERALSSLIKDGSQRILIVLDEMDHLLHSRAHQNVLYRLFSWASPMAPAGKRRSAPSCSLIGIANSLDLTERFVPLLASKGASPALLHFRPFEATEIVNVIRDRLMGLHPSYVEVTGAGSTQAMDVDDDASTGAAANAGEGQKPSKDLPLFTPAAVELLAKKIAAATGDLRKALDAARLAVEMVEAEQRKKALAEASKQQESAGSESIETEASQSEGSAPAVAAGAAAVTVFATAESASARAKVLSHLTPETAAKAGPAHILKVLATVLGSPNLSKIRNLGLQPKLVLLSLLVADLRAREGMAVLGSASGSQAPRVSKGSLSSGLRLSEVESTYASLLKNDGTFSALESSELLGVFELLEVQGILRLCSDAEAGAASSSRSSLNVAVMSSGVSPSGKRAAKKQLLAANRTAALLVAADDVLKGITTAAPASSTAAAGCSSTLVDTIRRIWSKEEERVVRSRGWEAMAREKEAVRKEELGGGRGQVAIGL
ncbi:uncharacterized protein PFL1_02291 [Pseudozyma flocculosa PF-1]|uniref:uncharacterized protein n=1 Tax=Pseudozyma flocculosa PF-1 TaxID=1277687 RepID=UPI00045607EB|nr:uncharacterized protein PFL1_02291 [Pseudozyma flocculosa PF-1]EPQ30175.1 hypothetical protein PFL1_02291 [Pseudozyma flocculosa PF-1]